MMQALKLLRFVANFCAARGLLFASPIVLANLLPLESYGQFELAHSYASLGAVFLGFGLAATVPLIRLRDEVEGRWDTLLLLITVFAGVYLLLAVSTAAILGALYLVPVLVLLGIAVLMMQGLWATSLKSDGRANVAVFVETGFWVVAIGGSGLVAVAGGRLSVSVISMALLGYAVCLLGFTVAYLSRAWEGAITVSDIRRNLELGVPLMFTSLLTSIISSSGRLVLGHTHGVEAVGLYAMLFRATTLPLVGHQVLIIGLFRQLFLWSDEVLRARAPLIVLGVSAVVIGFWLVEPSLGWLLGPRFVGVFSAYREEGLILLVQTILWSAIALNDLINSRLQIAGRVTRFTAPFLVVGLVVLGLWTRARAQTMETGGLLHVFIIGHFYLMAGFYVVQCTASWWLGHRFTRLWLTVIACTTSSVVLILLGTQWR